MQNIIASLEYGRIWPKNIDYFLNFAVFLSLLFLGILIAVTFVFKDLLFLCGLVLPCLLLPVSIWQLIHNHKLRGLIKLWIEDAVPIETKTKTVDTYSSFVGMGDFRKKIKIHFKFNGKMITRYSGKRNHKFDGFNTKSGYDSIFRKLAD